MEVDKYFYPNPLESFRGASRSPWFGCACCPSNVVRFVRSIPGDAYAQDETGLYINLFMAGSVTVKMNGQTVQMKQQTQYPWDGTVKITVEPDNNGQEFVLKVRIPGWARNEPVASDLYRYLQRHDAKVILKINSEPLTYETDKGYAVIKRNWNKGGMIE